MLILATLAVQIAPAGDCNSLRSAYIATAAPFLDCSDPTATSPGIPNDCTDVPAKTANECAEFVYCDPQATVGSVGSASDPYKVEFVPPCLDGTQDCLAAPLLDCTNRAAISGLIEDAEVHCVDGSRPAFHWDDGTNDSWVFYLTGETGFCSSVVPNGPSCFDALSASGPLTSWGVADRLTLDGVLSTDSDNPLSTWNRIQLDDCGMGHENASAPLSFAVPGNTFQSKEHHEGLRTWKALFNHLYDSSTTLTDGSQESLSNFANADQILLIGHADGGRALIQAGDELTRYLLSEVFPTTHQPDVRIAVDGYFLPHLHTEFALAGVDTAACSASDNGNTVHDLYDHCAEAGTLPPTDPLSTALRDYSSAPHETWGRHYDLASATSASLDVSCVDHYDPLVDDYPHCYDDMYVLLNEVDTPLFIRMDMRDQGPSERQAPIHAEDEAYRWQETIDFWERTHRTATDFLVLGWDDGSGFNNEMTSSPGMYMTGRGTPDVLEGLASDLEYFRPRLRECDTTTDESSTVTAADALSAWLDDDLTTDTSEHAAICGTTIGTSYWVPAGKPCSHGSECNYGCLSNDDCFEGSSTESVAAGAWTCVQDVCRPAVDPGEGTCDDDYDCRLGQAGLGDLCLGTPLCDTGLGVCGCECSDNTECLGGVTTGQPDLSDATCFGSECVNVDSLAGACDDDADCPLSGGCASYMVCTANDECDCQCTNNTDCTGGTNSGSATVGDHTCVAGDCLVVDDDSVCDDHSDCPFDASCPESSGCRGTGMCGCFACGDGVTDIGEDCDIVDTDWCKDCVDHRFPVPIARQGDLGTMTVDCKSASSEVKLSGTDANTDIHCYTNDTVTVHCKSSATGGHARILVDYAEHDPVLTSGSSNYVEHVFTDLQNGTSYQCNFTDD